MFRMFQRQPIPVQPSPEAVIYFVHGRYDITHFVACPPTVLDCLFRSPVRSCPSQVHPRPSAYSFTLHLPHPRPPALFMRTASFFGRAPTLPSFCPALALFAPSSRYKEVDRIDFFEQPPGFGYIISFPPPSTTDKGSWMLFSPCS